MGISIFCFWLGEGLGKVACEGVEGVGTGTGTGTGTGIGTGGLGLGEGVEGPPFCPLATPLPAVKGAL